MPHTNACSSTAPQLLRVTSPSRCTCSNGEWGKKKKTWRLRHIGAPASSPQRDVWLRHIGVPTRTLAHLSPLPPSSHLTFASPRSASSALSPSFLRLFMVSFVSSPQGRPAAFQIQSDLRHGMCFNYLLSHGPSLGFPLVLAVVRGQSLLLVDLGALQ